MTKINPNKNSLKIAFMKQLFFIVIFLTTSNFSFSQNTEVCENLIQRELISKIQKYKPTDLVPYYDAESKKWGFIHKKNKKIIVEAVFKNLQIFKPNLIVHSGGIGNCSLSLEYSSGTYSHFKPIVQPSLPPKPFPVYNASELVKDINGFEVNELGEIVTVNSMFFVFRDTNSNLGYLKLSNVFQYKNTYYGIVQNRDNSFSIYSDKGMIVDGFENLKSFPNIGNEYTDCNDLWILANIDSKEFIFKSLTTQETIKIDCSSPKCWDCVGRNFFGYQILEINGVIGVFDMVSMKWQIEPAAENKFHSIIYSSSIEIEKCDSLEEIKQNRKQSEIYLLTFDNAIVDIKGKSIEPKE